MNIVLVGATSGIGNSLAENLSRNNKLFIGSRNETKINDMVDNPSLDNILDGSVVDVSEFDSIEAFLDLAKNALGKIDAIINCAGSLLLRPPHMLKEDDILSVYKTNVFSCLGLLKYGFKHLKDEGGSFLFFSSAASKVGLKNHEVISGAKGSVSSIALSAASTYSNYNIRVNAIAPGLVDTPMTSKITSSKMSLEYSRKMHGLNRIGKPENFVPIVESLLNEKSDWITGQTIFVDGGLSNIK